MSNVSRDQARVFRVDHDGGSPFCAIPFLGGTRTFGARAAAVVIDRGCKLSVSVWCQWARIGCDASSSSFTSRCKRSATLANARGSQARDLYQSYRSGVVDARKGTRVRSLIDPPTAVLHSGWGQISRRRCRLDCRLRCRENSSAYSSIHTNFKSNQRPLGFSSGIGRVPVR